MKIAAAQIQSFKGDMDSNIESHLKWTHKAASKGADFIVFPELSLTGYWLDIANELAVDYQSSTLDVFQEVSDIEAIGIAVGMPTKSAKGVHIGMIIFLPNQPRQVYFKQLLHVDESPYFQPGDHQLVFKMEEETIAPAICYEALQKDHIHKASQLGIDLYMASVAKSQDSINKALRYFPKASSSYQLPILMSNSVGPCDDFMSVGQSGVWNTKGERIAYLNSDAEGLLLYNTKTKTVSTANGF